MLRMNENKEKEAAVFSHQRRSRISMMLLK
jgi:hypothetical protein